MRATLPMAAMMDREPTLLDAFYLPSGAARADFLDYFRLEYGEFSPLYQDPAIMRIHINSVSTILKYTLDKLFATLTLEYNPIENYDRQEFWRDTTGNTRTYQGTENTTENTHGSTSYVGSETTQDNGGSTKTLKGSETTESNGGSSTDYLGSESETPAVTGRTQEHQVAADNTGTYFPSTKDLDSGLATTKSFTDRTDDTEDHNTTTLTYNEGRQDIIQDNNTRTLSFTDRADNVESHSGITKTFTGRKDVDEGGGTREGRAHGNIGVMSTQDMINQERDVARFNFYAEAALLYASHLLIMVY